jgi:hypothetical protein
MKERASLIPNLNRETETQRVQDKNLIRFYYKNEIKNNKVVPRKHTQN